MGGLDVDKRQGQKIKALHRIRSFSIIILKMPFSTRAKAQINIWAKHTYLVFTRV